MRYLFTLTALAAALLTVNMAQAAGRPASHSSAPVHGSKLERHSDNHPSRSSDYHSSHSSDYHLKHGTKFKGGYYYKGRDHHQWSRHYYWSKYHCNCYYDPSTSCWYYWCQSDNCYYPTSYIQTQPPAPEQEIEPGDLPPNN